MELMLIIIGIVVAYFLIVTPLAPWLGRKTKENRDGKS